MERAGGGGSAVAAARAPRHSGSLEGRPLFFFFLIGAFMGAGGGEEVGREGKATLSLFSLSLSASHPGGQRTVRRWRDGKGALPRPPPRRPGALAVGDLGPGGCASNAQPLASDDGSLRPLPDTAPPTDKPPAPASFQGLMLGKHCCAPGRRR